LPTPSTRWRRKEPGGRRHRGRRPSPSGRTSGAPPAMLGIDPLEVANEGKVVMGGRTRRCRGRPCGAPLAPLRAGCGDCRRSHRRFSRDHADCHRRRAVQLNRRSATRSRVSADGITTPFFTLSPIPADTLLPQLYGTIERYDGMMGKNWHRGATGGCLGCGDDRRSLPCGRLVERDMGSDRAWRPHRREFLPSPSPSTPPPAERSAWAG